MAVFLEESLILEILIVVLVFTGLIHCIESFVNARKKTAVGKHSSDSSDIKTVSGLDDIPGPTPIPIRFIGNLFQLPTPRNLFKAFFENCKKYGPIFRYTVFGMDFVMISSASLAQSLLQSHDVGHANKAAVYQFLKGFDGLAFASGKRWHKMRKLTAQAFRYNSFEKQIHIFNKNGDRLMQHLLQKFTVGQSKTGLSLPSLISNCTVQIILDTFLSTIGCCTEEESLEYLDNFNVFTEITAYRILHPWLGIDFLWKRHPRYEEFNRAVENIELFAEMVIKRHIETLKSLNNEESRNETTETNISTEDFDINDSLISELLKANLSFKEIRSEVTALLFAHETNYLAMYYFLFLLAANPEHQKKCQDEVDQLLSGRADDFISYEDLPKLKYLERCLQESLRLLPPVYVFGRRIETPLNLVGDDSQEFNLPPGTNVLVLPVVMHKNPEYYPNPEVFDPDRFLPEECQKRHAYSLLPFSLGPRICLGMKSSQMDIKVMTAKILRKFTISTQDKLENLKFRLNITMCTEKELNLEFKARES